MMSHAKTANWIELLADEANWVGGQFKPMLKNFHKRCFKKKAPENIAIFCPTEKEMLWLTWA